jgi:hypothetical protein
MSSLFVLLQLTSLFSVDIASDLKAPVLPAGQFHRELFAYLESASKHAIHIKPSEVDPATWEQKSQALREQILNEVVFRGEAKKWQTLPLKVEYLDDTLGGPRYRIRKLRFEAVPKLWIPALLYEPIEIKGKVPAVLNTNGHDIKGFQAPYKQLHCINQVKRGMIAINVDWLGFGQLNGAGYRHDQMNKLDLCGTSGLAVFYLAMSRALDVLTSHPKVDPARIAMTGLSGGGWQTIFLSALDTRITLANPVAGYSALATRATHPAEIGDSEQVPPGFGAVADYLDLTALLAPRSFLLTYCEKDDCCFQAPHALPPLMEHIRPIYEKLGRPDRWGTHINYDPGTHNYKEDNREAFYRFIGKQFFSNDTSFDTKEIPSEEEVKSADELRVPLPEQNADFTTLAKEVSLSLKPAWRDGSDPESNKPNLYADQLRSRIELGPPKIEKSHEIENHCIIERRRGYLPCRWAVRHRNPPGPSSNIYVDGPSIPFVEYVQTRNVNVTIVISDQGKERSTAVVDRLVTECHRVFAIDLAGFGECTFPSPYIQSFVDTFSLCPLPIQSAQLYEFIRYVLNIAPSKAISIVAEGPRSSTIALLTVAAMPPYEVVTLELSQPLASLHQLVSDPAGISSRPELFCAGLLAHTDISDAVKNLLVKRLVIRDSPSHVTDEFSTMALEFDKRTTVKTELIFE